VQIGTGRLTEEQFFPTLAAYNAQPDQPAQTVSHEYDSFGRPVKETWRDRVGGTLTVTREAIAQYDDVGRVTRISSPEGVINYEYDDLGRHTRTYVGKPTAPTDAIDDTRYEYDALGRLFKVR